MATCTRLHPTQLACTWLRAQGLSTQVRCLTGSNCLRRRISLGLPLTGYKKNSVTFCDMVLHCDEVARPTTGRPLLLPPGAGVPAAVAVWVLTVPSENSHLWQPLRTVRRIKHVEGQVQEYGIDQRFCSDDSADKGNRCFKLKSFSILFVLASCFAPLFLPRCSASFVREAWKSVA